MPANGRRDLIRRLKFNIINMHGATMKNVYKSSGSISWSEDTTLGDLAQIHLYF